MKATGFWKSRGFFTAYVKGVRIGRFPTPEQAQSAIKKAMKG